MESITIAKREYVRVNDFNQFRHRDGSRRIGLEFWARMELDGTIYLAQEIINEKTDPQWLIHAVSLGCLYLHRLDFEITKIAATKMKE
ncbi:MAG: hypothetical protein RIC03_12430 [Cyclobacteriaceae bacterium]